MAQKRYFKEPHDIVGSMDASGVITPRIFTTEDSQEVYFTDSVDCYAGYTVSFLIYSKVTGGQSQHAAYAPYYRGAAGDNWYLDAMHSEGMMGSATGDELYYMYTDYILPSGQVKVEISLPEIDVDRTIEAFVRMIIEHVR